LENGEDDEDGEDGAERRAGELLREMAEREEPNPAGHGALS
jgi:hypothetical protein